MGIKARLTAEAFSELPEDVQAYYSEKGDSYVLDIDGINQHPDVVNLKAAHEVVKRDVKAFRDFANGKEVDEDGFHSDTRSSFKRLKARLDGLPADFNSAMYEDLKSAAAKGEGAPSQEQIAAIREQAANASRATIEAAAEENAKLTGYLHRVTVEDGLSRAMDAALIDPLHKPKLLPFLKGRAKIDVVEDEAEGRFKAVVDSDMGAQSLRDFVSDWAASDDGKLYVAKSTGPNPNGSGTGRTGVKTITRAEYEAIPIVDRKAALAGKQLVD